MTDALCDTRGFMRRGQGIYKDGFFKVSRRLLESSLWCQDGDVIKVFWQPTVRSGEADAMPARQVLRLP